MSPSLPPSSPPQSLPQLPESELPQSDAVGEAGFGALRTPQGCLPLKGVSVRARLEDLLAAVTVEQTFVNKFDQPLEAAYIFPLPDRAAVTAFEARIGGRVIQGDLKERGQARREYDEAIAQGHRAAIAEENRPNTFMLRVGNIMPGEEAVTKLTLAGPLAHDSGEVTFQFPLVVAPRYIPGAPLAGEPAGPGVALDTAAVPDASVISPPVLLPGFPSAVRLSIEVEVAPGGLAPRDFRSSLHAVMVGEETPGAPGGGFRGAGGFSGSGGVTRVRLQPGERLDRDFVLRYRVGENAVRTSLLLLPDAGGQGGTFALTLAPPAGEDARPRPRDVAILLDRSGSMGGWKMVVARRAAARLVDSLNAQDRFLALGFDDRVESPANLPAAELSRADDRARFRAVEFLSRLDARGGTELAAPLAQAVGLLTAPERLADSDRERVLILVTDGQVGNEDQILALLGPQAKHLRIFTLGVDRAVNAGFLRRLAALGGGQCELVESEDRFDEVLAKLHRRVGSPVLRGLKWELAGLRFDPASLTPGRSPDLFPGAPLTLLGRYEGASQGGVALQAEDESGNLWTQTIEGRSCGQTAIRPVYGRARVRDLEDAYAADRSDKSQLEQEIVRTSLEYGVLCRFTAYVAVDRGEIANTGGQRQRVLQPVEPAEGWEMLEATGCGAAPMASMAPPAMARNAQLFAAPPSDEDADDDTAAGGMQQHLFRLSGGGNLGGLMDQAAKFLGGMARRAAPKQRSAGKREEAKAAAAPPLELGGYRVRAAELQSWLAAQSPGDNAARGAVLRRLVEKLGELVGDLKSVGAAAGDYAGLEGALAKLQAAQATPPADDAGWNALWQAVSDALTRFSGQAPRAAKPFWK